MIRVVAIDMGYGHLRAAHPVAEALGVPLFELDGAPLATREDERAWRRARQLHEGLSRASQLPLIGAPFLALMDAYTHIAPLHPERDLSRSTFATRGFARLAHRGLGARLVEELRRDGTLLSTFYAAPLIADHAGLRSFCVVTDADCHRIWVPDRPARTRIRFLAPSLRVVRRLRSYGVPEERISLTGFPLPLELLGGPELAAARANLAARLARLDPTGRFRERHGKELAAQLPPIPPADGEPPLVVFTMGGAGAQSWLAQKILRALAPALRAGRLRLALVAGLRKPIADAFEKKAAELEMERGLEVLYEPSWTDYYRRFNALLARADILWTKPSEMTFYAALGLPLVLAPHVGAHERYNAQWAQEHGAGLPQLDPDTADGWLADWLKEGTLAELAWSGFRRLPARGTYEIVSAVTNSPD